MSIRKYSWTDNDFSILPINDSMKDDLFVSCIGYEPRTLAVLKKLDQQYRAKCALLFANEEVAKFRTLTNYLAEANQMCTTGNYFDKCEMHNLSIDNPTRIVKEIGGLLTQYEGELNITIDTTTFPRNELLVALYFLRHSQKVKKLRLLYVSPLKYGRWLSRGYRHFSLLLFFEGPSTFEKSIALLILTGFEKERAISLIEDIEPASIFLALAEPGTDPHFEEQSKETLKEIKARGTAEADVISIPGNDPFKCKEILEDLIAKKSSEYDFYVAPIGPKLAVVCLYLAYEHNPNFRIVYPQTMAYNVEHYSSGCRDVYEIILEGYRE